MCLLRCVLEEFLREVRVLVHEAIGEGGGELVSDVLGTGLKQANDPVLTQGTENAITNERASSI